MTSIIIEIEPTREYCNNSGEICRFLDIAGHKCFCRAFGRYLENSQNKFLRCQECIENAVFKSIYYHK